MTKGEVADMYDEVVARIIALGYLPTEDDHAAIAGSIERAEWAIKNDTNLSDVPTGLHLAWIDMAAGLFLRGMKAAGQLPIQFEAPAKSISEGDTTVSFAVGGSDGALTPEAQLDALLDRLLSPPQEQLAAYRRMRW